MEALPFCQSRYEVTLGMTWVAPDAVSEMKQLRVRDVSARVPALDPARRCGVFAGQDWIASISRSGKARAPRRSHRRRGARAIH